MVRNSLLDDGPADAAACVAHEFAHVQDVLEDGWLYDTFRYGGASELRGYHVSAEIFNALGGDSLFAKRSIKLDEYREQQIGNTEYPFTPDDETLQTLVRNKII